MGDGLSTMRCVPADSPPVTVITVSVVAGCAAVLAVLTLIAAWFIANKHYLGPPGVQPCVSTALLPAAQPSQAPSAGRCPATGAQYSMHALSQASIMQPAW